jgi:membrane associated rhomboid family serine protease
VNEAEHAQATDAGTIAARAPFVRAVVISCLALYFVQLTLLAPADVEAGLGFASGNLGQRWWTIVSFPFVHAKLLPLGINVGVLALFGGYLERRWGTAEYARYFAICALGAWVASVATAPPGVILSGAAAPAIGTLLAFAATAGQGGLFRIGALALSAGWLAMAGTLGILTAGIIAGNADAALPYLAHAAGLVAGWTYLRTASSINFVKLREGVSPVPDEPEDSPPRAIPRNHPRTTRGENDDIVARSNAAVAREATLRQASPPAAQAPRDPAALDRVLDKISAHGLGSLSPDERKLLDELSRKLRDS